PLISVNGLSLRIGADRENSFETKELNFKILKGETLGIVGESGSGKSITSLSIMRLLPPEILKVNSGKISWNEDGTEINLLELDNEAIRKIRGNKISMIFQEPMTSLNPSLKCGYQVQEAVELHSKKKGAKAKEYVLDLFKEVKLPTVERMYNSYPHQLSGGQKQRVMIAMALSTDPELLIADEPTTALDITVQKSILKLLKEVQTKKGLAMIFITHDLGVVNYLSDKLIVMRNGEIVEHGDTKSIINNPSHPYTKGLLACRPPIDTRPKRLLTVKDFTEQSNNETLELETNNYRKEKHELIYGKKPILSVNNLHVWFPVNKSFFSKDKEYVKAVNGVSFDVFKGETLGLVGESGCGKSTLGRTILQLNKATSGEIIYDNQDLCTLSTSEVRKRRKKLQIIFQDPYSSLNPKQKIGEAILEPMLWYKIYDDPEKAKEKTYELLEKVGLLPEHFDRYPHEFSGGQRQRINIARCISIKPELIICDESVSALDVSVQAQVLNLLNDLKDEFGLTYIFISHDLSVIKYMSDRVMVMNKGEIEEVNEADSLYKSPQTKYTEKLISSNLSF
ncbi:MAG: peptide/nickel transport system ATP-binding protein, partial [Flavobacteriales bacterium]